MKFHSLKTYDMCTVLLLEELLRSSGYEVECDRLLIAMKDPPWIVRFRKPKSATFSDFDQATDPRNSVPQ